MNPGFIANQLYRSGDMLTFDYKLTLILNSIWLTSSVLKPWLVADKFLNGINEDLQNRSPG